MMIEIVYSNVFKVSHMVLYKCHYPAVPVVKNCYYFILIIVAVINIIEIYYLLQISIRPGNKQQKQEICINVDARLLRAASSPNGLQMQPVILQKIITITYYINQTNHLYLISVLPEYRPVTHRVKDRPAAIVQGVY